MTTRLKFFAIIGVIISLFSLSFFPATSYAQDEMRQVNSFDLFWPVVAGKTRGDSLYFAKKLKENLRGLFIFGAPEKADYMAFLATKRIVEAEKLMNDNKKDLADGTLDEVIADLGVSKSKVDEGLAKGVPFPEVAGNIVKQSSNISLFAGYMATQKPEYSSKFDTIKTTADEILSKLK